MFEDRVLTHRYVSRNIFTDEHTSNDIFTTNIHVTAALEKASHRAPEYRVLPMSIWLDACQQVGMIEFNAVGLLENEKE